MEILVSLGFTGSPTILVDGENPFGGPLVSSLGRRRYETDAGWEGAPGVEEIEHAVAAAT